MYRDYIAVYPNKLRLHSNTIINPMHINPRHYIRVALGEGLGIRLLWITVPFEEQLHE